MTEAEKRRGAFHDARHALAAMSFQKPIQATGHDHRPIHSRPSPDPFARLGATLQLPAEERYMMTRDELLDRIAVMMGGRVAEQLAFEDVSTGAENDLERATETARQMVCRFGMSERMRR